MFVLALDCTALTYVTENCLGSQNFENSRVKKCKEQFFFEEEQVIHSQEHCQKQTY